MKSYKKVLSIAGSDSGGGAGIQADIKSISACGCFAMTAITATTAQNTMGVVDVHTIPVGNLRGQITAVIEDIGVDAVKLGMLPTLESVLCVAELIERYAIRNVVLDPVMVATSGDRLISTEAANAITEKLLPLVTLITPNIPETEYITGLKIGSESDFEAAAQVLKNMGAQAILLKAGHLNNSELTDYLFYKDVRSDMQENMFGMSDQVKKYCFNKINTANTHGTGCSLSSAIAAYLAHGLQLDEAVSQAEKYLHGAILAGADYTTGKGHGPVHHFYKFWD